MCCFFKKGLKGLFRRKKSRRHFTIFGPKMIGLKYLDDGQVELFLW
jgi:hypothetical protein